MFRTTGKRSGGKEMARLRREATEERARVRAAAGIHTITHTAHPTPSTPTHPVHAVPLADSRSTPRDFSALRGDSTHPWRTIRRRNHWLLPQWREQHEKRPFPKSFPKRAIISTPDVDILAVDSLLMLPPPPPPVAVPLPPPVQAPTLPAKTPYGLVRSSLALSCAGEKAVLNAVSDVFDIAWGPHTTVTQKFHLLELPGDQLGFLCMLAEFVALEPVFREFLHPAIANFAHGWVTHCLQDSFG
ncbi:hypothetical protein B0H19DRAFT_1167174 [Mycena capillaripes]|nr:hypothetical protein B0H19DRAFT_1167174 [Mycena capillaripes]